MTKNSYQFIPAGSVDIFTAIKKGLTACPKAEFFLLFFLAPCKKKKEFNNKKKRFSGNALGKAKQKKTQVCS